MEGVRPLSSPDRLLAVVAFVAAILAGGCDSATGLIIDGGGEGESVEFPLRDGVYRVRWTAEDAGLTDHGCLFGLTIEQTAGEAEIGGMRRDRDSGGKLAYRAIGHGEKFVGDEPSIFLANGSYRFRSEGSCAWQVEILPGEPAPTPTPGIPDLEQA